MIFETNVETGKYSIRFMSCTLRNVRGKRALSVDFEILPCTTYPTGTNGRWKIEPSFRSLLGTQRTGVGRVRSVTRNDNERIENSMLLVFASQMLGMEVDSVRPCVESFLASCFGDAQILTNRTCQLIVYKSRNLASYKFGKTIDISEVSYAARLMTFPGVP